MSVCLCVCLSQKSLFPYSRDFVVSHVYSYIPYSVTPLPYSRSFGAPCAERFCTIKGFCRFPVSRHFPFSVTPPTVFKVVRRPAWVTFLLIQRILSFSCFQTLSVFKGFCCFPVSGHFPYSRDFAVFLFPDTFRIQGILSFSRFQTLSVISDPRVIRCPLFVLWLHKRCCLYLCLKWKRIWIGIQLGSR